MVYLRQDTLVEGQVRRLLEILMDIRWEDPLMECQVGRLKDIHWDCYLVHIVELREVRPMGYQVVMVLENLRVQN